ncbi:MAG: hypothetical protein P8M80_09245 [Pirellulaceae bacterium]|nr:hypothetical protein [Pirellulaceae bacterium]
MRSALTKAGLTTADALTTDVKGRSASFTVAKSVDVKKQLEEIAAGNKHVNGFTLLQ